MTGFFAGKSKRGIDVTWLALPAQAAAILWHPLRDPRISIAVLVVNSSIMTSRIAQRRTDKRRRKECSIGVDFSSHWH